MDGFVTRPGDRATCALCVCLIAWVTAGTRTYAQPASTPEPTAPEATPVVDAPAQPPSPERTTPADPPWTFRLGEALLHPELQVRLRGEARVHPYASSLTPQDESHLIGARFRLGLGVSYRALRVLIQLQDARDYGSAPIGTDVTGGFGVHQAYFELRHDASFVRVGRQEVAYGDERMIGPLDWTSSARAFDAVRAHFGGGRVSLDAMGAIIAPEATYRTAGPPPTTTVSNGDFLGAAQLALAPVEALSLELLYLVRRDGATATDPLRDRRINASSLRLAGTMPRGFRVVAEGIFEWGEIADTRMIAYAAAFDAFYAPPASPGTRFALGGAVGSGERSGKVAEFENFFPTNHKFYGYADLFGLRNLLEGHVSAEHQWADMPLKVLFAAHVFGLERADARWTNAVGAVVAPQTPGDSRFVGAELDAMVSHRFRELLALTGGYAVFIPAAAAERLGRDEAHHFLWLMLDLRTP